MLTNLNQLEPGNTWPINPENKERHDMLVNYRRLFKGEPTDLINSHFERISCVVGNFQDVISFDIKTNYYKKVSIKTADLLLGEMPTVTVKDDKTQEKITELIEDINLWNTLYECVLDVSRFGYGIINIYRDEYGQPKVAVIPSTMWYPVVSPSNIKKITNHVIAYKYAEGKQEYVRFEIHYKGMFETRIHELKKQDFYSDHNIVIGKQISKFETYTGLSDFAIVPISNITSSDSLYGISDYDDIISIVGEIEVRLSQISKILDKHADPSMQIPASCVQVDEETGEAKVKLGDAFVINSKDDAEVKYITWDGQLESNFEMLRLLFDQLGVLSELGSLFMGNGLEKLGNISGAALRKLAFNALAKINRLQMRTRPTIIQIIKLASELRDEDQSLMKEKISVKFGDGLPNDISDIIDQLAIAVQNGVMSQERAIQILNDDMSQEEVLNELKRIKSEKGDIDNEQDNSTK